MNEEMQLIKENWGTEVLRVILDNEIVFANPNDFSGNFDDFLDNCIACGGDWGQLLLSGLKKLFPKVYKIIPENMGKNAWACLCATIKLLGIEVK